MLSVLWALIPTRYLYTIGAALAALLLGWAALAHYGNSREATGYTKGWNHAVVIETRKQAVLVDSLERHADSIGAAALHSQSVLNAALHSDSAAIAAPRHTPRIEALTVPVTADTTLVGVFVQTTGEHFVLPRRAAMYWATSDSLVGVATKLLAKYAAANQGWANAYTAEHEARVGADSLAALWRTRALANVAPPPRNMHRIAYLALGIAAGFIAAKRIH